MYEYWIGEGVDFSGVWSAYDEGKAYEEKFRTMRVHLIQFTFREQPPNLPLFNHEAIYKTIKGYFHDLKRLCLSSNDYATAGPLFLYEVNRGSGVWSFLGELRQLLLFGTTLADQKLVGQKLDNIDKKLNILEKYFGGAIYPEDFEAFMRARTPRDLELAVKRMIAEGLQKVEISRKSFTGEIKDTRRELIDVKEVISEANSSNTLPPGS